MGKKQSSEVSNNEEYLMEGLACTDCAARIEDKINDLSYIDKAEINFARSTIKLKKKDDANYSEEEIKQITKSIEPGVQVKRIDNNGQSNSEDEKNNKNYWRLSIGVIIYILALVFYSFHIIDGISSIYGKWLLFGTSYLLIGGPVLKTALVNLKQGHLFDENFLMLIATLGAFSIQEFPEAVAVMLFYMIGEMFQDKAVNKSRHSIKELMDIKAEYAHLVEDQGISRVEPSQVMIGDVIVIKPGEKIPLDGEVIEGESRLDTSALTGESVPRKVEAGDTVLSGMVNREGLLRVKVTKNYNDSTVARILKLVEEASSRKAPTEKFITRFAHYYTPIMVYSAMAIALLPPLVLEGAVFSDWFYRALIFLVVSCPCALVISIPLGFFGGIGRASRQGVLVKGGNYLEALNRIDKIVFDKTGTMTEGSFKVEKVVSVGNRTSEEILAIAAKAESHSNHPIANSIKEAYSHQIEEEKVKIDTYQELSGKGIRAIRDGKEILVGNEKLLEEHGISFKAVSQMGSIVYVACDDTYLGYLVVSDKIKGDALQTVQSLKKDGIKELIMLTGDREEIASKVSKKLGFDRYYAGLLPHQKVEQVEKIMQGMDKNKKLAFVGDGINDAPVLARADLGIAMGGLGSDAAIEAADVVLMTDEPSKLVTARKTAALTQKIVWQNIILALGVKALVLILGFFGMATMWEAVFADVGVALLAVFNSMRILNTSR